MKNLLAFIIAMSLGLAVVAAAPRSTVRSKDSTNGAASNADSAEQKNKFPLKLELPPPYFVSGIVAMNLTNIEPAPSGKRPEFLVPLGTTNLAKGKRVTSSDSEPVVGSLNLVTDGDKSGGEGSWVELGPGKQWVQIDLEKEVEIFAVVIWHCFFQHRAYFGVVVQISNDSEFKGAVTTVFNNDYQNLHGFGNGPDKNYYESYTGKLIDAKGVKGRYVRLYSAANTSNKLNHYIEVEVFGRPVDTNSGDGKKVPLKTELPAPFIQ